MATRYAKGDRAWGICQRCGQRAPLSALLFDEQYPNLRVHAECWDEKHPQERLRPVSDPSSLWKPSPEEYPYTAPVLELTQESAGAPLALAWSAASSPVFQFNGYRVMRAIDDGEYAQLADLPIVRDDFGGISSEPLTYADETDFGDEVETVSYYVVAYAGTESTEPSPGLIEAPSNIEGISWAPETFYWQLDDSTDRYELDESDGRYLLEEAPDG